MGIHSIYRIVPAQSNSRFQSHPSPPLRYIKSTAFSSKSVLISRYRIMIMSFLSKSMVFSGSSGSNITSPRSCFTRQNTCDCDTKSG